MAQSRTRVPLQEQEAGRTTGVRSKGSVEPTEVPTVTTGQCEPREQPDGWNTFHTFKSLSSQRC